MRLVRQRDGCPGSASRARGVARPRARSSAGVPPLSGGPVGGVASRALSRREETTSEPRRSEIRRPRSSDVYRGLAPRQRHFALFNILRSKNTRALHVRSHTGYRNCAHRPVGGRLISLIECVPRRPQRRRSDHLSRRSMTAAMMVSGMPIIMFRILFGMCVQAILAAPV